MSGIKALVGADIFDGRTRHKGAALIVAGRDIAGIMPQDAIGADMDRIELDGGLLAPGFVDLQVNGGGGVQFNSATSAQTSVQDIETICKAHAPFGTTSVLATLITDTPEVTAAAVGAGIAAAAKAVPGFLGLHLEGPHLSVAKKGAHDPDLIRPMTETDVARLLAARAALPHLMVTVAPETVLARQIAALAKGGVIVSLGHSAASYAVAQAAAEAGASAVTHLFNAMSPLGHREPGLVGAALASGSLYAGIIADGIHVDPAVIAIAHRAKAGPAKLFLVTDAMATLGTSAASLTLNGRTIERRGGRLTLPDGTLAGADLDMASAVRFMAETVGVGLEEALRMAALYPAHLIGAGHRLGHFSKGAAADMVHLDEAQEVRRVWIGGQQVFPAR